MEGALKFTRRGTLEGKKVVIQGAGNVGKGLHVDFLMSFSRVSGYMVVKIYLINITIYKH